MQRLTASLANPSAFALTATSLHPPGDKNTNLASDLPKPVRRKRLPRTRRWRSWRGARRLFLDRLPSLKAPEAPGGSRACLVGQNVVVVLDDIGVLRCVDQRVVLIVGLVAVVASAEPAEGSPEVHLHPLPGASPREQIGGATGRTWQG